MKGHITDPVLADCPTHGRVHHHYFAYPNAWICRIKTCRHFLPDEEVAA